MNYRTKPDISIGLIKGASFEMITTQILVLISMTIWAKWKSRNNISMNK